MTPFRNNLQKGDTVLHAESRRMGSVKYTPQESSRMVGVVWQGTNAPQYVDVMKLRLLVGSTPEDVPPIDGTPPDNIPIKQRSTVGVGAIEVLEAQRDDLVREMKVLEERFKTMRTSKERLDQALAILKPAAKVEVPRVGANSL